VSKIGDVSVGRSEGGVYFERSTVTSALGKKDARLPPAEGIESNARLGNNKELHHLKRRDLDEKVSRNQNIAGGSWLVSCDCCCRAVRVAIAVNGLTVV
jgi:hypothetical protein